LLALASNLKQTTRGHNEYVTAMREAAYTIWQLRNTNLDTANESDHLKAENAKLRELCREIYEDQCCDGDQWKYRDRLRELGIES
jgi:hypothetical protein